MTKVEVTMVEQTARCFSNADIEERFRACENYVQRLRSELKSSDPKRRQRARIRLMCCENGHGVKCEKSKSGRWICR